MHLLDGLNKFKSDIEGWQLTQEIEKKAEQVLHDISLYGDSPTSAALDRAMELLTSIEKWKAMCMQERMGNAFQNPKSSVWYALYHAVDAEGDIEALHSIMQLKGFGSTTDAETGLRRAKVATSVLRFVKPIDWGVVDWRTVAMLSQIEKFNGDIDRAVLQGKQHSAKDLRKDLDIIDENMACEEIRKYRSRRVKPDFPRAADVEMAIFGLSLITWAM